MTPAAVLSSHYNQSGQQPLQWRAQCVSENINAVARHQSASRYIQRHRGDDVGNHYGTISKTLGERVSVALTKRLFPNTNLTRKQLQDAIKVSIGTMDNLLKGEHDPSGRVLDLLVAFFRESFINEVWGAHNIHCIDTRAAEKALAVAQLVAAQAELRRLG